MLINAWGPYLASCFFLDISHVYRLLVRTCIRITGAHALAGRVRPWPNPDEEERGLEPAVCHLKVQELCSQRLPWYDMALHVIIIMTRLRGHSAVFMYNRKLGPRTKRLNNYSDKPLAYIVTGYAFNKYLQFYMTLYALHLYFHPKERKVSATG